MRYQGGKSRIAKDIATQLGGHRENLTLVSLFCGACNIESKVEGYTRIICNDNQKYLIALFKALQNGYIPPDYVSEEDYKYIREHKDENPALTGFVGFGCSFGGKWFGGYARDAAHDNYALRAKKSLERKMKTLMDVEFMCEDYRNVILPDNCIVYADPPYHGTTGYSGEKFDTQCFWEYMRKISESHIVYISELKAPDDFKAMWQKKVTRTLDVNKNNQFSSTEKLYVHEKYCINNTK